jgi:hypothetical protein
VGGLAAQALVTLQDKLLDRRSVVRRGVPPARKRIESRDENKKKESGTVKINFFMRKRNLGCGSTNRNKVKRWIRIRNETNVDPKN